MVDFITKLSLVAGKNTILVVYDSLFKIMYFVATIKETSAKELVRLFRDNMWKLYGLPESIVSDRGPQFAVVMMKELNVMLEIETKLLTAFHLQIDGQTERMNQELEQYLRFFVDYRQKDWLEWLASAEFAINNKTYSITKMSPFMTNYRRKLKIGMDLRRKGKMEKSMEFAERMRKVQEKVGAILIEGRIARKIYSKNVV